MARPTSSSTHNHGQGGAETAKENLRGLADAAGEKVKEVAKSTEEMADKLAHQAREYGEQVQDAAKQVRPWLEKSLKEQPTATLAGAAVVGFILGALWKKIARNRLMTRSDLVILALAAALLCAGLAFSAAW